MSNPNVVPHARWCEVHGKKGFTKDNAKKVARLSRGRGEQGSTKYPCGVYPSLWHVGHLGPAVLYGVKTRGEVYGSAPDAA